MGELQHPVSGGAVCVQNSTPPDGNSAFLIPKGIDADYLIFTKGFILTYTLHIGKLRPKEAKELAQGHTEARAGQDKFIPLDRYLQAPAVSQLSLGVCICASPPCAPPFGLPGLLSPGASVCFATAHNTAEEQRGPERLPAPPGCYVALGSPGASRNGPLCQAPNPDPAQRGH